MFRLLGAPAAQRVAREGVLARGHLEQLSKGLSAAPSPICPAHWGGRVKERHTRAGCLWWRHGHASGKEVLEEATRNLATGEIITMYIRVYISVHQVDRAQEPS